VDWPQLGWVDVGMIAVVVLSALAGAVRGLTFELLSLAGWVAAWCAGLWLGPSLSPYLPIGTPGSPLNVVASFACAFIVVLILCGLMARMVSAAVKRSVLSPADRLLGAAFGVVRGVAALLAIVVVLAYTPAVATSAWRASVGVAWLNAVLREWVPYVAPHRRDAPAERRV
jgi:membrane protein required for colicin V production